MTVTSRPRWRAEAATSAPIHPAPTTTTCRRDPAVRAGRPILDAAQIEDALEFGAGNESRRGSAPVVSSSRS